METKQVTAQDFISLCESPNVDEEVEALLSRVRKEAVDEYKKSILAEWQLYNVHDRVQKIRQEAREKTIKECENALEKDKQEVDASKQWVGQEVLHATDVALTFQKLKSLPQ